MSGNTEKVFAFTKQKLKWLMMVSAGNNKAILAEIRKGIGKKPGDNPKLWGVLFEGMPESLMSKNGEPTAAEWAVYTAITVFSVHQQGKNIKSENMNVEGVGLGRAVAGLVKSEEDRERVERRFYSLATTGDMQGISHYLREIVKLLRDEGIGLDYAILSKDLYLYQKQDNAPTIRLKWGQDFYSELNKKIKEDNKDE